MIDRRSFIKSATLMTAAGSGLLSAGGKASASKMAENSINEFTADGMMPDTLDLAHHGALAVNGTLGSLNPELDFETVFLTILDRHPAYMLHWSTMIGGVMPIFMQSMPMLRNMSGSTQYADIEQGFVNAMLRNAVEDGLVYDRAIPSRPWNVGVYYGKRDWNEDYASLAGNAQMMAGFIFNYHITGDKVWISHAEKTALRMLELAIVEGDYAWYPNPGLGNDFSYPRISGWTTKAPPKSASEGYEGASMYYQFLPVSGFTRYYRETGDERFLDLSRKFAKLGMQEKFWGGADTMSQQAGAERGHFRLHFHASAGALRCCLDYALAANDYRAIDFVHNGYSYARQTGLPRLGLFPTNHGGTEGCSIADMVGLAITLTDAGLGDYWDDVEKYARNGLVEAQATDIDELRRVSMEGLERPPYSKDEKLAGHFDIRFMSNNLGILKGQEIHKNALERSIGAFGHLRGAQYQTPMMMSCCTAGGGLGLYFAWEGIVRKEGEDAVVNMWLNRRSPWVDVLSYLPQEGRLDIHNKGMKRLSVRKPSWARPSAIRCRLDGRDVNPEWRGNRMVFSGLAGNEGIVITTNCPSETAQYTIVNIADLMNSRERYEIDFKGHTAVKVRLVDRGLRKKNFYDPGEGELNWYRLFRRENLRSSQAAMKPVPEYVHNERLVRWEVL